MSPRRTNLSSPPVVIGVLAVLAVLVVVNVRTFAPRRVASAGGDVRVQAHPALPLDLEDVLRQSGPVADDFGVPVNGPRPALARDPFLTGGSAEAAPVTTVAVPGGSTGARSVRPVAGTAPRGALSCAAVMLGGGEPAALLDGRLCRVGDRVRGYVVVSIETRGVRLDGESSLFLPVGISSRGEGANVVVTGKAPVDGLARPGLVEYADTERN